MIGREEPAELTDADVKPPDQLSGEQGVTRLAEGRVCARHS